MKYEVVMSLRPKWAAAILVCTLERRAGAGAVCAAAGDCGGAGVTKAERIRNAWMEYQRAMNELQVTQEMGIYAPGLVEKVIQKKREWLEAQGKE